MKTLRTASKKSHVTDQRPPFECIALLLQGGGALGSYQAGVYQALAEARLHPDWVAGISIGAINAAIIAGTAAAHRIERLREFWEAATVPPLALSFMDTVRPEDDATRRLFNQARVFTTFMTGAPALFAPRMLPPYLCPSGSKCALSYYDDAPLRATLERLIDFDRINAGAMRFSVGAVNVRTGNFVCFDTATHHIDPSHVMASTSLPPGFPPTEIEGEHYWDGGLVSNTPLQWVLDSVPRMDTLAFQVDLWSARGELPRDINEVNARMKDIQFSSRTRAVTDQFRIRQGLRRDAAQALQKLPQDVRLLPEMKRLEEDASHKVFNIIHMIYHARPFEGTSKSLDFSRQTMEEHWESGYNDAVRTLRHPEVLQRPASLDGVRTFDLRRDGRDY